MKGGPRGASCCSRVGALLLFTFLRYERRRGQNALIEPTLLRNRTYLSGIAVALALFGAFGGLILCVSLFGQLGEGWSPIHAGLTLTPMVVGMIFGMLGSLALVRRLGRHVLHMGIAAHRRRCGVAGADCSRTRRAPRAGTSCPACMLIGAGVGASIGQLFQFILSSVSMEEVGSASGVLEAVQQLSTALGVAVLGTIFFSTFGHHLPTGRTAGHGVGLCRATRARLRACLSTPDARTRRGQRRLNSAPERSAFGRSEKKNVRERQFDELRNSSTNGVAVSD